MAAPSLGMISLQAGKKDKIESFENAGAITRVHSLGATHCERREKKGAVSNSDFGLDVVGEPTVISRDVK